MHRQEDLSPSGAKCHSCQGATAPKFSGQPLPPETRRFFSDRFGADFSDVRLTSDHSAVTLGARAYTIGNQIVFAPGQYSPESRAGKRLLAHELSHVLQQRGGAVQMHEDSVALGNPSDAAEQEAHLAAERITAGWNVRIAPRLGPASIRRAPEENTATEGEPDRASIHSGGAASGLNTAWDAQVRMRYYVDEARRVSQEALDDISAGRVNHMEARQQAQQLRNEALAASREKLTPGGRMVSEAIKEEGMTLPRLVERYSQRTVLEDPGRFGLSADEAVAAKRASEAGKAATASEIAAANRVAVAAKTIENSEEVSRAIINAAGRTNRAMTVVAKVSRVAGPAGVLLSAGVSSYEIVHAKPGVETARVATREAGGLAGGWLGATAGGLAAGWTASLLCGPGAAVCAIVVTLVVVGGAAYAGGRVGEWTATSTFDALLALPNTMIGGLVALGQTTSAVAQGAQAMISAGMSEFLYSSYGSLDPANWQINTAIPASGRADLAVLGQLVWAQMRPDGRFQRRAPGQTPLDAFLANSGRSLSYFGVDKHLAARISAACAQAQPNASISPESLLLTPPVGLVGFLRDNGLVVFRQAPSSYARGMLATPQSPR